MALLNRVTAVAALGTLLTLGACADDTPGTRAPTSQATKQDDVLGRAALVYRAPNVDGKKYKRFMIDQVAIYRGGDAEWGEAPEQDKQQIAAFIRSELVRALGDKYPIVAAPGPDVARVKLTLAGMENNTAVVAPVSRVFPVGAVVNISNELTGKNGTFTGSVTLTGEMVDSVTNQQLVAFAQKRGPDALDIGATFADRDAQRAAITSFADAFRKRIDEIQAGRT